VDTRGLENVPTPEVSTIQYYVIVDAPAVAFDATTIGSASAFATFSP